MTKREVAKRMLGSPEFGDDGERVKSALARLEQYSDADLEKLMGGRDDAAAFVLGLWLGSQPIKIIN